MSYFNLLDQKDIFKKDLNESLYVEYYIEQIMKCKDNELMEKVTFTLNKSHFNKDTLKESTIQLDHLVHFENDKTKMENEKMILFDTIFIANVKKSTI